MPCEDGRKYLLGDHVRGALAEAEAAGVREHLKDCPDCRQDLAQFERVLPLLAHFAEEHIPADSLVDYYHKSRGGPARSADGFWNAEMVEKHLAVCDQCQALFDELARAEKEFAEISKEGATEPYIEKPPLKSWVFLRSRRVLYAAVAAAALLLFLIPNLPLRSQGPMIAVLPFEYTGPPDKEYYAEGIPNDITSRLAKVSALGVIAPSSTIRFKNTAKKPAQVGEELGVDYLLTGSIRWDTTGKIAKLRVVPRLVRTKDEKQLWTEPLEIVWGELCGLPGMLGNKVVAALNVEFLESERKAMEACPTGNIEAYEYYLRGVRYADRWENMIPAAQMFEKAVQADPNFALGFARLSLAHTIAYMFSEPTEERLSNAKRAAERAIELQPDLPEARLAMGGWMLWAGDERAKEEIGRVESVMSNNSEMLFLIGCAEKAFGNFDRGLAYIKKAAKLDPLAAKVSNELGWTYVQLRKYKEAERELDRGISHNPDWPNFYESKAHYLCLRGEGDIPKARKVLQEAAGKVDSTSLAPMWATVEFIAGNYQKALAYLPSGGWSFLMKAKIYNAMNQHRLARLYFDSARALLEPRAKGAERRLDAFIHKDLGVAYAGLGRREEALREGKKATELLPVSGTGDALWGPIIAEGLAEIYVMVGEYDAAIDQLEYLLSIPSFVSIPYLRIDPIWAPLRSHPRFQKLLNERA